MDHTVTQLGSNSMEKKKVKILTRLSSNKALYWNGWGFLWFWSSVQEPSLITRLQTTRPALAFVAFRIMQTRRSLSISACECACAWACARACMWLLHSDVDKSWCQELWALEHAPIFIIMGLIFWWPWLMNHNTHSVRARSNGAYSVIIPIWPQWRHLRSLKRERKHCQGIRLISSGCSVNLLTCVLILGPGDLLRKQTNKNDSIL